MPEFVRPVATALGLAISIAILSTSAALAQAKPQPATGQAAPPSTQPSEIKQIALTAKQIEGVLAAAKGFDSIDDKPNSSPADGLAQLDAVARKNGFANYTEHETVVDNIRLVLVGFDPATKKYVGPEAAIKAKIAVVQADKKMPADERKDALTELNDALKSPPPAVTIPANIDLVAKRYDKLAETLKDDD